MSTRAVQIVCLFILVLFAAVPAFAGCNYSSPDGPQIEVTPGYRSDGSYGYTITHNGVDKVIVTWRGVTKSSSQPSSPGSDSLDVSCLTGPEPLTIRAEKCTSLGYDPIQTQTMISVDGQPTLELRDMWGDTATHVDFNYTFPHTRAGGTDRRLTAILYPDSGAPHEWVMDENGTGETGWAQAVVLDGKGGTVVVTALSCTGKTATLTATVKRAQKKCDKDKNPHKTGDDSCCTCTNDPVHTASGNMRVDDVDPIPSSDFFPMRRRYDSRSDRVGVFGRGWTSLFSSFVRMHVRDDGLVFASVGTEGGDHYMFQRIDGTYVQIAPTEQGTKGTLTRNADGTWTHVDAGERFGRIFTAEGRPIAYRELATGREVQLTWVDTLPMRIADSWGNWALNVTTNPATRRLTSLAVDGRPDLTWTYVYSSDRLVRVDSPVGTFRTYEYQVFNTKHALTVIRDGAGKVIEQHAYDSLQRATNSTGPTDEITSIVTGLAGRNANEEKTTITYKTGRVETQYQRLVGGRWRIVEIDGGCSSCGAQNAAYVHDATGNVVRAQRSDGYIAVNEYDANKRLTLRRTSLRPATCDPATASERCRLTTGGLAAADLVPTSSTLETTYAYGDANWPDRPTTIGTLSVLEPAQQRVETKSFAATTGELLTHAVTGWTGNPARQETRLTSNSYYDGAEGASFLPGGAFDPNWASLPQPLTARKAVDGPLSGTADEIRFVHYPINPSVPQTWRGRLAAVRNAAGHITRYEEYDVFGNATRTVDAHGVVQLATFDALGRPLTGTLAGVSGCDLTLDPLCATDLTTSRTYSGAGPLAAEQRAGGGVTSYEYDSRSRVRTISRGPAAGDLRERIEYSYDVNTGQKSLERLLAFENGVWVEKKRTAYTYDSFARLSQTTNADNTTAGYTYDAAGRVASVRDENHTTANTTNAYDPAGRLSVVTQVLAAGSVATAYGYDVHGNLASVTDPNGNVTTYVYDDFGQMLRQESPVSGTTTYEYDLGGRLTNTVDANSAATARTYDVLGRVQSAVSTRDSASETVSWTYDLDRVATMSDPTGSTAYDYDRRGLLVREQKTIGSTTYTTSFGHDADGNRTRVVYPGGRVVDFTFDHAGRPTGASTGAATLLATAAYLPFGPQTQMVFGNGTTRTMTYDARYRLLTNQLTAASGTLASYSYGYDPAGNVTNIGDVLSPAYNRTFAYDDLNRLVTANTGTALWGLGAYTYDAMGNVQSYQLGARNVSFAYDSMLPKLTSVTDAGTTRSVSYDAAGNEQPYLYSPRNHMVSADSLTYAYDGRGVRTITTSATGTRHSLYTPELQLLSEPGTADYIWLAGHPLAQIETATNTIHWYLTDHLGTPILTTNATATVDWHAERDPYGTICTHRVTPTRPQPLAFPGQEEHAGSETAYNVFRWYRAGWGRYTQGDPILGSAIASAVRGTVKVSDLSAFITYMTPYAYVGSNPVNRDDPNGLGRIPGWGKYHVDESCTVRTCARTRTLRENELDRLGPPVGPGGSAVVEGVYWPGHILKIPDNCNVTLVCTASGNFFRRSCITWPFPQRPQLFRRGTDPQPPAEWPGFWR